jgi:hypothetical protein
MADAESSREFNAVPYVARSGCVWRLVWLSITDNLLLKMFARRINLHMMMFLGGKSLVREKLSPRKASLAKWRASVLLGWTGPVVGDQPSRR